jgi:hypothetical protein
MNEVLNKIERILAKLEEVQKAEETDTEEE